MESIQQGHPQASVMLEYAQVAATNKEPWKEFEYFHERLNQWFECPEMINLNYVTTLRRKSKMHKIGNKYKRGGIIYILARTAPDTICLINTEAGTRWSDQMEIEFSEGMFVKHEDIERLIGPAYIKEFALIND